MFEDLAVTSGNATMIATPTVRELEDQDARNVFIAERLPALGTAKLATAIQDDMSGHHGHEPNSIAMLLSGLLVPWTGRRSMLGDGIARGPSGNGAGMSLTMAQRKRLREGRRYPETTSRDCWTGSARKRGRC